MLRPSLQTVPNEVRARARQLRTLAPSARRLAGHQQHVLHDGLVWTVAEQLAPSEATAANESLVVAALDQHSIRWVRVRNASALRATIAIAEKDRARLEAAIRATFADEAVYLQPIEAGRPATRAQPTAPAWLASRRAAQVGRARVVRIGRLYASPTDDLRYDLGHGCDVEIWTPTRLEGEPAWATARPTVAGSVIPESILGLAGDVPAGDRIFERDLLDDITYPIDAVYTWVDGADPVWRAKLNEHRVAAGYHEEATAPSRFQSRDELKYSLRSLFMFAPWIRHVYLVTDGQVPDFLDVSHPRITVVDHRDIAPDPSQLPVFSSNAITTWLHRVPGLSEHYLFLNDDMFFGRPVAPDTFFTGSGLCKVFPGNTLRPFGPPRPEDPPHVNLSRNIRTLIEETFGRTFTQAIKHTPYPQLVSVHAEMEARFPDVYRRTSSHRFRHHDDIAGDQLFHYYARGLGRAVVGSLRYEYVNINDQGASVALDRLRARTHDAFCFNDGPRVGTGIPERVLVDFLERYFPIPSPVELSAPAQRS